MLPQEEEKKPEESDNSEPGTLLGKRRREDSTASVAEKRQKVDQETQTYEVNKKFVDAPTPKVDNYYKTSRRGFTTTLVLPSSIVDNA